MALYGLIVWSGWRRVSGQLSERWLIVAAAAAFPPFWNLILYGQITIFILIAFWLGWLALERGRAYLAGAAFGLLALKPQFGIPLAAIVLACGEWRMLVGAIGSVAAQAAIIWLAMGGAVFGAFASTLRVTLTYADWQHEPPRQVRSPLQLAETHLHEQQCEHADGEGEEAMRPLASRGEVTEAEQEREQEDPDDGTVDVDDRLEPAEPVDLVRLAAA